MKFRRFVFQSYELIGIANVFVWVGLDRPVFGYQIRENESPVFFVIKYDFWCVKTFSLLGNHEYFKFILFGCLVCAMISLGIGVLGRKIYASWNPRATPSQQY